MGSAAGAGYSPEVPDPASRASMPKPAIRLLRLSVCLLVGLTLRPAGLAAVEADRGQLLVATPEMEDPNFAHAVVLVIAHDAGGALGLVINRPYGEAPAAEVLQRLGVEARSRRHLQVFYGGPVQPDAALVVHSDDYRKDVTTRVTADLDVTGGAQILADIGADKGPRRSLLVLGYSGWGPGQLDDELAAGDWQVVPALPDLVLGPDPASKWQRAIDLVGTDL